jgi:sporulation protein YqfC
MRKAKTRRKDAPAKPELSGVQRAALRIGRELDLPPEILPGFSSLEMLGNRQAIVQGVKGVLCCGAQRIDLNLGSLIESFVGANLCVRSYLGEEVILAGDILEIHFTQG